MNKKNETLLKGFTQIPNSLVLSGSNFTDREFRLYCILKCHSFGKSSCFPGRKRLSDEMNASIAKIDRTKKSLIIKKVIVKKRRGQGETNIYSFNKVSFPEADKSPVIPLEESLVMRKEDEVNNTKINNYLDNQKSYSNKEKFNSSNSEPLSKTPTEVVFRTMINRIIKSLPTEDNSHNLNQIDYNIAKEAILYYIKRYREICGEEHSNYRKPQLEMCFFGFICEIIDLKKNGYSVDELPTIITAVIEKWFSSTSKDVNNLKLSHFIGGKEGSFIFSNCLDQLDIQKD